MHVVCFYVFDDDKNGTIEGVRLFSMKCSVVKRCLGRIDRVVGIIASRWTVFEPSSGFGKIQL